MNDVKSDGDMSGKGSTLVEKNIAEKMLLDEVSLIANQSKETERHHVAVTELDAEQNVILTINKTNNDHVKQSRKRSNTEATSSQKVRLFFNVVLMLSCI